MGGAGKWAVSINYYYMLFKRDFFVMLPKVLTLTNFYIDSAPTFNLLNSAIVFFFHFSRRGRFHEMSLVMQKSSCFYAAASWWLSGETRRAASGEE